MSCSQQVPREISRKPPACFQTKARELPGCRHRLAIPSTSTRANIYEHFPEVSLFHELSPCNSFCFPLHRAAGGTAVQAAESATLLCELSARAARGTDFSLHCLIATNVNSETGSGGVAASRGFACSKITTMRAKREL